MKKAVVYSLVVLLVLLPLGLYIHHWIRRLVSMVRRGESTRRGRIVMILVTVLLSVLTLNFFSMTSVVFLHFWVSSALVEALVWIVGKLWRNHPPVPAFWRGIYRASVFPAIAVIIMMSYGAYNMSHIVETAYEVSVDKRIRKEGYRILLLTDVHYGSVQKTEVLQQTFDEMCAVRPDLVILGGDIVEEGTSEEELREVFGLLGRLENRFGIYYVYGNHDRQPYTGKRSFTDQQLEYAITSNGIRILQDERVLINGELVLVGRGDSAWGNVRERPSTQEILGDADREKLILVADHQPVEAEANAAAGADVQLSGHTHAGQIWPTGVLTELIGDLNYGAYDVNGNHVIVSSGVSGWKYPVRTGKHCEYVVVDIQDSLNTGRRTK